MLRGTHLGSLIDIVNQEGMRWSTTYVHSDFAQHVVEGVLCSSPLTLLLVQGISICVKDRLTFVE